MTTELNPRYTITKSQIMASIGQMPEDATTDDVIEKMIFIKKIEEGLKAIEESRVFSHESVKEKYKSWRQK